MRRIVIEAGLSSLRQIPYTKLETVLHSNQAVFSSKLIYVRLRN